MLSTSPKLTSLEITPQASSIALGLTAQFKATGKFSDGSSVDETKSAVWTSSNGSVASIDTTGFATSLSIGSASMIATVEGISTSTTLTVSKAAIASIMVDPSASSIALGSTTQLKATGTYTDHSTQDVTNIVAWQSSEPNVAVVSSAGLAASKSIGNVSITATSGSVNASCQLTVSQAALVSISVGQDRSTVPLGVTAQLTAQGVYTDGSTRDLTSSVSWSSSPLGVVNINAAGLATGLKIGTATVNARSGTITGTQTLTVSAAQLTAIAVSSNKATMPLGTAQQITATGTYSDGSTHDLTSSVSWSSSPLGVVNVNTSGLATGLKIGTATVNATSGTVTGTWALTVSAAQLTAIAVNSDKATMPLGTAQQMTATGTYTDGSSHDLTNSVSWSSSALGVVNVNTAGLATGLKIGTATVNASSGTITGTQTLTVSAALLTAIAVNSNKTAMPLGAAQQMTATGTYTDGSTHDLTSSVSWSSSPLGVININAAGLATGLKIGTATVNAKSGSITGTRTLTVSAALLTAIAVSSDKATMPLGTAQQMTATGTYTDGSSRDLTSSVSWSSASDQIVSVSSGGVAQARAMGSTAVSATTSAINGSAALTVSSPALASISISPTSPTIPLGNSLQLGAIGSFTDGSTQDLTNSAIWSVVDASVVNLSSTGNATAQQVGSTSVEATLDSIQGSSIIVIEPVAAVSYFTTGPEMTDTTFRFTNPGSTGANLCAMTYVFDQDQQMAECCGCLISPDGLRTLSLNRDLISNPLTGTAPVTGTVLLVTADYASNPSCNASSITPGGMAIAWATHLQTPAPGTSVVSEETLSQTPLSATLSSALQAQCQFIQQLGSGQGICSCGTGD